MSKEKVLALADKWKGQREKIVDVYNTYRPLPRGYTVKYQDALCATYVSALFIHLGLTDIVPPECGAMQLARNMQALGRYKDRANHAPEAGDLIFFDWQGDNWVDHVGLVTEVRGGTVVYSHIPSTKVTTNEILKGSKYIRGYGCPDYGEEAEPTPEPTTPDTLKVGDLVTVNPGAKWYGGQSIKISVISDKWYICSIKGDRAVLGMNFAETKNVQSPIHTSDLTLAKPKEPEKPKTESCTATLPILRRGDVSLSVKALQAILVMRGYMLDVDGDFGKITETTVKGFQSGVGLVSTGIVDGSTWEKLIG